MLKKTPHPKTAKQFQKMLSFGVGAEIAMEDAKDQIASELVRKTNSLLTLLFTLALKEWMPMII